LSSWSDQKKKEIPKNITIILWKKLHVSVTLLKRLNGLHLFKNILRKKRDLEKLNL